MIGPKCCCSDGETHYDAIVKSLGPFLLATEIHKVVHIASLVLFGLVNVTGGGPEVARWHPRTGAGQERCDVNSQLKPFHDLRHCLSRRPQAARSIEGSSGEQKMRLTNLGVSLTPRPLSCFAPWPSQRPKPHLVLPLQSSESTQLSSVLGPTMRRSSPITKIQKMCVHPFSHSRNVKSYLLFSRLVLFPKMTRM